MVDAADSKSAVGNYMWVQVPPPAPEFQLVGRSLTFAVLAAIPYFFILPLNLSHSLTNINIDKVQ